VTRSVTDCFNQARLRARRAIWGKEMGAVWNDEIDLSFSMGDIGKLAGANVHYTFVRHKEAQSGEESLVVTKWTSYRKIWRVSVCAYVERFHPWNESYPYDVTLTRYPRGPEFNVLRWLSELMGSPGVGGEQAPS
jgi:hypothetical protein